ncbi:hypothetical protein ACROYT_G026846 [Oculina patagonica]
MKGSLLSIFVFLAVLATGYGLKCYTCIGTEDSCSKDKLKDDSSKVTTCPSGYNVCMRTWAKNDDGDTAVVQSCGTDATCKTLKDKCDEVTEGKCAVGCCDTDLCNAGSPVSFSMFLMTVCAALGLALLK